MEYGLIGEHLGHSYSKEIHGQLADYEYELHEIAPEDLDAFMKEKKFKAINVTIPYKQDVIPYLDEISDRAKAIGAVNTIVNHDGRLSGDNTDFAGMKALAEKLGLDMNGKKVLILGTGGTSKTAKAVAESMGAAQVFKVSRSGRDGAVTYEEAAEKHSDAAIIINTTPCGMYPKTDACAIDISKFPKLEGILDAIYNPLRSNFIMDGIERGLPAEGGLYMLSAQAVYACGLFLGKEMSDSDTERAFRSVLEQKQNIVLIGMPSCGKTTIGNRLSEITGRKLVDTDELVVEKIGTDISSYFAEKGEKEFRDRESEAISEISKESGLIIATGGGAVLRHENIKRLKQNGIVVFIDRSIENLITTDDRPLSSNREALQKRFDERYDIYRSEADVIVDGNQTIEEVTQAVLKAVKS